MSGYATGIPPACGCDRAASHNAAKRLEASIVSRMPRSVGNSFDRYPRQAEDAVATHSTRSARSSPLVAACFVPKRFELPLRRAVWRRFDSERRAAREEADAGHFQCSVLVAWPVEEISVTLYESKLHRLTILRLVHLVDDHFDAPVQVAVLGAED